MPRVSILIPNYNNGRASSRRGDRDFLGDLLASLQLTLAEDPTSFEILIADDGSTDDSLDTARRWAAVTRSDGSPFCRLIELPHRGVLSAVLNTLMREARGEFFFRLDGDVILHTPNWVEALVRAFTALGPDVGVLTAKQLAMNGRVHSAGDWLIHPRGYHHVAQGALPEEVDAVQEVDHAMGCFYAMRRRVWESVGDYDETILRGQTEDYGVRVLLKGWRVFSIPDVEFTHFHADRAWRDNTADTPDALQAALDRFEEKWGFNRLVPDLDEVRRRYAGTTLLWRLSATDPLPAEGECTDRWQTFASDARLQSRLAHTLQHVADHCPGGSTILEIGCGDGLLGHLLALRGYRFRGLDRSPVAIDTARRFTASAAYPTVPPHYECVRAENAIAAAPGEAPTCILLSHLERHPNPRAAIDAAHRLLPDAGLIIATALLRPRATEVPAPVHLYRPHELQAQLVNSGLFQIKSPPAADATGLLTTTGIRLNRAVLAHFQRPSPARRAAG